MNWSIFENAAVAANKKLNAKKNSKIFLLLL